MLNLEQIAQRIEAPELCTVQDIDDLKLFTSNYPYAQIFPILYLKGLANNNDIRFEAAVGVAYLAEYCQFDKDGKPMGLWAKPHIMLGKVAEALALRKAYPQDLSGIYTSEEMQQADESAYLKTHLTELDVELAVDLCVSKTELKTLYSYNMNLVDASPELKEIFKTKQSTL